MNLINKNTNTVKGAPQYVLGVAIDLNIGEELNVTALEKLKGITCVASIGKNNYQCQCKTCFYDESPTSPYGSAMYYDDGVQHVTTINTIYCLFWQEIVSNPDKTKGSYNMSEIYKKLNTIFSYKTVKKINAIFPTNASNSSVAISEDSCIFTSNDSGGFFDFENFNSYFQAYSGAYGYILQVEWEEITTPISYYNQDGTPLTITGAPTEYDDSNGVDLSNVIPINSNFTFGGWYLNDPTCSDPSAKVTSLQPNMNLPKYDLYAKWLFSLTFFCTNFNDNNTDHNGNGYSKHYMINVYKGNAMVRQIIQTSPSIQIELDLINNYSGENRYKIYFVFGVMGNVNISSTNVCERNARYATLTEQKNQTIEYSIVTPNTNTHIMI